MDKQHTLFPPLNPYATSRDDLIRLLSQSRVVNCKRSVDGSTNSSASASDEVLRVQISAASFHAVPTKRFLGTSTTRDNYSWHHRHCYTVYKDLENLLFQILMNRRLRVQQYGLLSGPSASEKRDRALYRRKLFIFMNYPIPKPEPNMAHVWAKVARAYVWKWLSVFLLFLVYLYIEASPIGSPPLLPNKSNPLFQWTLNIFSARSYTKPRRQITLHSLTMPGGLCANCRIRGHTDADCPHRRRCSKCSSPRHDISYCREYNYVISTPSLMKTENQQPVNRIPAGMEGSDCDSDSSTGSGHDYGVWPYYSRPHKYHKK